MPSNDSEIDEILKQLENYYFQGEGYPVSGRTINPKITKQYLLILRRRWEWEARIKELELNLESFDADEDPKYELTKRLKNLKAELQKGLPDGR